MRLVLDWLREFVDVPEEPARLAEVLALRGFEVAEIDAGAGVIDFEITANRPDCLSVLGLAREASAALGRPVRHSPAGAVSAPAPAGAGLDVVIEDAELCPRYAAQVASVTVGPSPNWLTARLEAAGVRPINNVVDATNYVMLEMGHPMHAFDLERLAGRRLEIRRARPGERLRTLDGVERALEPEMLVIADAERPQALAGVMGGADSEVGTNTRLIALESAYFQPAAVRRASRRMELKTEASARFERGADRAAPVVALRRVCSLLEAIEAGQTVGPVIDRHPSPPLPLRLTLRRSRLIRILGIEVPDDEVRRILERLGFGVKPVQASTGETGWLVTVPTFRVDVSREIDLVEEVGRHHGYDRVPATFPTLRVMPAPPDARIDRDALVRRVLTAAGCSEAVCFTFIERRLAAPFAAANGELVAIANPLSEKFAVLRPSILPGLLEAIGHNRRRERRDVRLFETGSLFPAGGGERRAVGLALTGAAAADHWSGSGRAGDFFDAKGVVEQLCEAFRVPAAFEPAERPYLVAGQAAAVQALAAGSGDRVRLGLVGQLAPEIAAAHGIPGQDAVHVGEIDLDALSAAAPSGDLAVAPLPRFPSVVRDLSVEIDEALPAASVRGTIRSAAPATLADLREFDRYQGKGVPEGRVSLSFRLTFRAPERTLTDAEVDAAMQGVLAELERAHGARRR